MTSVDVVENSNTEINSLLEAYLRKPFQVSAVQVTDDNLELVADWCGGEIRSKPATEKYPETRYIKTPVSRPLTHRQTIAYPGDWVLQKGKGFKVYTNEAFEASFVKAQVELPVE